MEGCPRSLMLNVDLKEPFPTEFTPSLKTYIREHYNEDADSYNNECSQLEQLRTASIRPSRDHSGCSTLRRYYAQLQFLQSRFPMGDGGAVNVQFTWTDLYSEEPISLFDIKFEQASILHNLASLHSQLGSNEDRTTEEGMKVACTHFQSAAGIFQYLKAGSFCKVEHFIDHFASDAFFDMAGGLLQLYTNVMLGQAQECLLEKSILDSRKDSLVARISMQVYEYYNQALQFLDSQGPSYMGSRKAKLWSKSLKIKCCQYLAVAYIHMSNNADENQKFGEKVAYLKAASQKITEAQKASKGQPERTLELLQFLIDVVSNKLQGAVKDNDFIYHEAVPELDSLPEIKAAPLVKPIPFQPCDSSVSGPDIFQRLIPMGAHADSSLYSEEKAKLLRRYVGSIEQKNQLLSKALSDLHIDDLLEPEGYDTLPAGIVQKRNSLINDGTLKDVESNVEELTKVGTRVEEMVASLTTILEEDKKREKEIQELVPSITPPPEREEFEKELEQCRETHKKAMQTNTELVKVFQEHKHNLDLLVGPSEGLLAALPSLNIIDTPIDDGAVQRLRDLISKVELMKSQRKQLEADLRKQLEEDDITQLLVTREGNKTLFFEEQLKKHDATCDLIQKNLDAQSKILKALTEANAKYAPTRQAVKETAQRRDDAVQTFVLSHDTFFGLKEKLSRGLRFYQSLEKTVLKLEEKLKEFAEKRKKEMDKIEEKEKRIKEKAKVPPARPGAEKPSHLINPPGSSVPRPMATQYLGGPGIPHPGMRPGTLPPTSHGVPLQPRIPGAAFPPRSFPGSNSPRPADPRVYQPGSQGVSPRLPVPSGEQRMQAPQPGVPLQHQQNFPEQRVPQAPNSSATGPPIRPTIPSQPGVPFSQMGPRGPAPAEHLIHSTPRMSYPVPLTPSFPPGGAQGVQPGGPGGPYQVPHPSGQQPRPQLAPGQVPGPGSTPGLPSYDLAKRMPGTQPPIQQPPPQNWPQGQYPATSQQQAGGLPLGITPQQPFQAPRGPYPTSQPPHISPAGSPQVFPQQIPTSQMSQPLQPATSQYQPKNWPTQPFHFPKLAQQPMQPQQQFQQIQQPYQRQQQLPHQLQLQPQPLHPQQQASVSPQQQQPARPPPQQQHPLHPTQQQPPHPQQQFQQPQFPPPLQPQNVPPPPSHMQQQFQHGPPSQPQQKPQQPPYFQQQQHPLQPPQQSQQPMQQFQQPVQINSQFNQPQQQIQHSREPLKPTQVPQPKQQQQQQQFQPSLPPQLNYQQQLQPMQPQKTQQQPYKPPLQPQPFSMQKPLPDYQIPTDRLPQQAFQPGKTPPQNAQGSLGPQMPQQISQVPELPPKGRSQMSQMPGSTSWPHQSSNLSSQPPQMGYPSQKSYAGYSQSQQSSQTSNTSSQLGYPMLPEKKRSQADPPSSKPPQEGFPSQHPGSLQPGPPSSLQSWGYPQASQPLSSTGASHGNQLSRQDSKEPQRLGGNQMLSPKKSLPYEQRPVDQGWAPSAGVQRPPPPNQAAYSPVIARQNSADYGKDSQYQGQTRGRVGSYPPYTGIVTKPPSSPAAGNPPYSYSAVSVTLPLVQGVRPSPTSLPPSSAYATSYSVSVAQAQLNQQQQMQQLQTQMLLQQQQLILQQQELLRQQQQQQHHESDQGHLTQLFQQMLQQQTKLAEMEQKLAEHERHEESLKKELTKTDHEELAPAERDTEAADNEPQAITPQSSSSFSASWSTGFSDHTHNKLDIEQVFNDLAKKQISEISEKGKHADGVSDSSKPDAKAESDIDVSKKDSDTSEHSEKEIVGDKKTEVKSVSTDELTKGVDDHGTAEVINTEQGSVSLGEETNDKSNSSSSTEQETEKSEVDSSSSAEDKPDGESRKRENTPDEDKEKQRRQQIEEQIQQIKELQKNTQPAPPPLPQKKKYLYEPGKMPEACELPLKPSDTVTAEEPNKPSLYRQCGHYYDTQQSRIGQAENNDCLSEEEYIQRLSFTVETFDALVVNLSQKKEGTAYSGFIHEWKALEKMQESDSCVFSTKDASLNPSKNRYRDVLPWDHTRVKLTTKEGGDYINANLIKKVTPMSPDYILTQGPIAATLDDFWLLVWEQKSPVIVMLTKEVEGNRLKCHQYWPIDEGHTVVYGNIRVHMRSKNHSEAWIERIMHVQHSESDEVLVVSHLQFTGWPDHGVPYSPSDLLTYLSEVHNHHYTRDPQAERPLVVHCSAGVGRAGTFCVIYTAIRELNGTGNIVNIPKLVRIFRQHRKFTVQKKEQYEFCYRAILFYANQYLQLEKTAIAFKKSKLASHDHPGDVSSASSVTSLSDSGQRKTDEVSFLGEISSDEDSSDSSSEFDEEKSSLIRRKTSQDLEDFDQIKTTDLEISGLEDSSQVTSDSLRDDKSIPCTSTISADLPAVGESSGSVSEVKDSSVADTQELPKASSDLSAAIEETKGSKVEELADHDAELKDVSVDSLYAKKESDKASSSCTSNAELTVTSERSSESVEARESIEEPNGCSSGEKGCNDEVVEEDVSEKQVVSKDTGEESTDKALEIEGNAKEDGDKIGGEANEQEQTNTDQSMSVTQTNEQTESLDEKNTTTGLLKTEATVNGQQGQETQEEKDNPQENGKQGGEGSEQQGQENVEKMSREPCKSREKEPNNEQTEERKAEDCSASSGDDRRTEFKKKSESESLEQTKQDCEYQQTNGV